MNEKPQKIDRAPQAREKPQKNTGAPVRLCFEVGCAEDSKNFCERSYQRGAHSFFFFSPET